MPTCYESKLCSLCKVENCSKRVIDYSKMYDSKCKPNTNCDAKCNSCNGAISYGEFNTKTKFKELDKDIYYCYMYSKQVDYETEFIKRKDEIFKYSKTELAISQIEKCENCKILNSYNELFNCKQTCRVFNEVPDALKHQILKNSIYANMDLRFRIFDKDTKLCQQIYVIEELIFKYAFACKDAPFDYQCLCKFIKRFLEKEMFFIHPLTIKYIIQNMKIIN